MNTYCQIDSVVFRNGRCFGWGWFLHPERVPASMDLRLRGADGTTYVIACLPGGRREDVRDAFPEVSHAVHAGFLITGSVPGLTAPPAHAEMEVAFRGGGVQSVTIPVACFAGTGGDPQGSGTPLWRRALDKVRRDGWRAAIAPTITIVREWGAWWAGMPLRARLRFSHPRMHVIFDHAMGGGANRFADELHANLVARGMPVMYVAPVLHELRYAINLAWKGWKANWRVDDLRQLLDTLDSFEALDIHLNELVSYDDPLGIVRWCTARRAKAAGDSLLLYLHDFHAVCPSWTLIGTDDRFCGIPAMDVCANCLPRNSRHTLGYNGPGIPEWRQAWASLLGACDRVVAFSRASVGILHKAYPALRPEIIELRQHAIDLNGVRPINGRSAVPLVVGVAGHVNIAKGALMLKEMAVLARERGMPVRFLVFGTLEQHEPGDPIEVFGEYRRGELPDLFEKHGVAMAMLPSVCAETYSYVTAEYMAMDMPVAVFPMGAPAERVADYPKGLVISRLDPAVALDEIIAFASRGFGEPSDAEEHRT